MRRSTSPGNKKASKPKAKRRRRTLPGLPRDYGFLPHENPGCGGCILAVSLRRRNPRAGCADHEPPDAPISRPVIMCPCCGVTGQITSLRKTDEETRILPPGNVFVTITSEVLFCEGCWRTITYYATDAVVPAGVV